MCAHRLALLLATIVAAALLCGAFVRVSRFAFAWTCASRTTSSTVSQVKARILKCELPRLDLGKSSRSLMRVRMACPLPRA